MNYIEKEITGDIKNAYPNAITSIVTPENYDDFLMSAIITNKVTK